MHKISHQSTGMDIVENGASILITINEELYSKDVVLRAAYWLTEVCHVHIDKKACGTITVNIRTKDGRVGPDLTAACEEFRNSLIDFALRARIASETQDIQRALIQRAFIELLPKPVSQA